MNAENRNYIRHITVQSMVDQWKKTDFVAIRESLTSIKLHKRV